MKNHLLTLVATAIVSIILAACTRTQVPHDDDPDNVAVPVCIQELIQRLSSESVANPPESIHRFEYRGKQVYEFGGSCCDQLVLVYDGECNTVCSPAGGLDGRGDGQCTDFSASAVPKGVVWQDQRSFGKP